MFAWWKVQLNIWFILRWYQFSILFSIDHNLNRNIRYIIVCKNLSHSITFNKIWKCLWFFGPKHGDAIWILLKWYCWYSISKTVCLEQVNSSLFPIKNEIAYNRKTFNFTLWFWASMWKTIKMNNYNKSHEYTYILES